MIKNAIWLFIFALFLFLVFLPAFRQMQDLKQKNLEYYDQIERLKVKNAQMEEEKRLLLEDPVYLEKIAREKFGIVRDGEVVVKMQLMNAVME